MRVTCGERFSSSVAHRPSVEPLRSYFSCTLRVSGSRLFITTIRMLRPVRVLMRISPKKRGIIVSSHSITYL